MPLTPGEDTGRWPELHRERRALVVVDVVESVRLMQQHEDEFIDRWQRFVNEVRTEVLPKHGGRLVKSLGDGMLLEFAQAQEAVAATLAMLAGMALHNQTSAPAFAIQLRAGAHVADVVRTDFDILGIGANLAARLASLASPGQTVVSAELRDCLADGVDASVLDLGECYLKHVDVPVRAFALEACSVAALKLHAPARLDAVSRPRIAVFPLVAQGGAAEHAALGDAIADDLIAALSRSPALCVLSRLSTRVFQPAGSPSQAPGPNPLAADYLLSGTVRAAGSQMRVHMEFCEAKTAEVLWSDSFLANIDDFFFGQDNSVNRAVSEIGAAIQDHQVQRVRSLPIPNLDGYTLYLGGVSMLHRLSRSDFGRAHDVLEQLAERETRSASPCAMLAKWHIFRMVQGWSDNRERDGLSARDAARRALDRDPSDALSLAMDGVTSSTVSGRLDNAEQSYRRAILQNPNEPYAWAFLSGNLSYRERAGEAIDAARQALALSPVDPARFLFESYLATAQLVAGRYDEAVDSARQSLKLNAMHTPSHRMLIIGLVMGDRMEEARAAAQRHLLLEPHFTAAKYLARYPGRDAPHAQSFASALLAAGLQA